MRQNGFSGGKKARKWNFDIYMLWNKRTRLVLNYKFRIFWWKWDGLFITINADTIMIWTSMKRRFEVEDNGIIYTSWKDDEDWTEIHSER